MWSIRIGCVEFLAFVVCICSFFIFHFWFYDDDDTDAYYQALVDKIIEFQLDTKATPYFPTEIAEAIHQIWKDPIIPKIMDEHSSDFYLMDSAG